MSEAPGGRSRTGPIALSLIPAILLAMAFTALMVFSETFRGELVTAWDLLRAGEPDALTEWLLGYGVWAPLVSGLLQLATSIFPPGPSFLLGIANAMLYGAVLGGLLTFVTALLAAAVCFGIARVVGRPGVEALVSPERLARVDGFMARRGVLTVFVARLIPFINPDVVSYVAGVTGLRWVPFLLAVGAGAVPSTILYSIVGATALETTGWVVLMVLGVTFVPLLLLALFGKRVWERWEATRV